VRRLEANAYIKRFVSGKRRSQVKFKEELTIVTEFNEKMDQLDLIIAQEADCISPIAMMNTIVKDALCKMDPCHIASPAGELTSLFTSSGSWESSILSFTSSPRNAGSPLSQFTNAGSPLSQFTHGRPAIMQ
jgi:hypothetical protein